MSTIKYRSVNLGVIIDTREVARRAIFSADGTTYLYTEWTFDFTCRYNPGAVAFRSVGAQPGTPLISPGQFPFETDTALRHYLMQPRGLLEVSMGNGELMTSPQTGFTTDAKNGPIVEACDIMAVKGERQFLIHFRVKTWVNECYRSPSSGNPLLSHRWTRFFDGDHDHYATIITEGEATFRTDVLLSLGTYPDQYRRDLFHAVPPNCQRGQIHVQELSDGTGVRYRFEDKEKALNYGKTCVATRIEAYQTAWYSHYGIIDSGLNAAGGVIGGGIGIAGGLAAAGGNPLAGGQIAGAGVGQVTGALGGLFRMPKYNLRCFCRAWGNRNSTRSQLSDLAKGLCVARVGGLLITRTSEMILTHDLMERFVECDVTVSWGLETAVANNALPFAAAAFPGLAPIFVGGQAPPLPTWDGIEAGMTEEDITIGGTGLTLSRDPGILNPVFPNSNGTRGTWLGRMIHQVLSGSCEIPAIAPSQTLSTVDKVIY